MTNPNADTEWIDAKSLYVIDSGFIGGMGAEDALPFGNKEQAENLQRIKAARSSVLTICPMLTFSSKSKQKCRLNVEAKVQTAFLS